MPDVFDNSDCLDFLMWYFKGREDVIAEQRPTGAYIKVLQPWTEALAKLHLTGKRTFGLYLISDAKESLTYHTVIDIDELDQTKLMALTGALTKIGLTDQYYVLEFSGSKGYHIWIRYEDAVPAREARAFGHLIVRLANLKVDDVEVFPKQDTIASTGFGNLVKLPLGLHQKSGKESAILGPTPLDSTRLLSGDELRRFLVEHDVVPEVEKAPPPNEEVDGRPGKSRQLPCVTAMLRGVGEGKRDNVLFQLILHLRRTLDQAGTIAALRQWDARNKPPLGADVIERKVHNAWNSPARGLACDKDWMAPFCKRDNCPVFAKPQVRPLPPPANGRGGLEEQRTLLAEAVPESGFLHDYVAFAIEATDAPEVFHLFCGLSALSALIGRRIWLPFGDGEIYPNLWTVIISGSSLYHKTSSLNIAVRMLREISEGPGLILPNEFSPEVLISNLADQPNGLFVWSEIKSALSMMERSYMAGTKELLTELYDCPDRYTRRLKGQEYVIVNPVVSVLAATTLDWLIAGIKQGDVAGGFLARFIFVPATAKAREEALPPPTDKRRRREIAQQLARCGLADGAVDFTLVRRTYEDWYYKTVDDLNQYPDRELFAPFWSRLTIYAIKIAMLLEASSTRDVLIRPETMQQAIAVIEYLKASIRNLLTRELQLSKEHKSIESVFRVIESMGAATNRDILRQTHMLDKDVQPILQTLCRAGRVKCENRTYQIVGA